MSTEEVQVDSTESVQRNPKVEVAWGSQLGAVEGRIHNGYSNGKPPDM